jgi:heterodisulfide reductase subunit B
VDLKFVCRENIEICLREVNAKFGSNFGMPVVYYVELISVACSRGVEISALDGQPGKADELEEIAAK